MSLSTGLKTSNITLILLLVCLFQSRTVAAATCAASQVRVLHAQQLGVCRLGRTHVHEGPQQQPLAFRVFGHLGDVCTPSYVARCRTHG